MAEQPKSYEKVLTYLEDSLRRGQLSLGDPLPPERELAEQLGISRNSVREAVRLLEHMGFIVSNQGAGNFICCNIQRNLQDSFDLLMLLQQIDYRRLGGAAGGPGAAGRPVGPGAHHRRAGPGAVRNGGGDGVLFLQAGRPTG